MKTRRYLTTLAIIGTLAACAPGEQGTADPSANPSDAPTEDAQTDAAPEETETVSILRPEITPPEPEASEAPLEPLLVTIGFPDGGSALDAVAVARLEDALASEQMALGGPIILGAHSDSGGSDEANRAASQARGLAVAEWLIGQGIAAERITVIAFGEQNPIAQNALRDGSPSEAGRAANRRVEIEIAGRALTDRLPKQQEGSIETGD